MMAVFCEDGVGKNILFLYIMVSQRALSLKATFDNTHGEEINLLPHLRGLNTFSKCTDLSVYRKSFGLQLSTGLV